MIDWYSFFVGGNSSCDDVCEPYALFLEGLEVVMSPTMVEPLGDGELLPLRCSEPVESCEGDSLSFVLEGDT